MTNDNPLDIRSEFSALLSDASYGWVNSFAATPTFALAESTDIEFDETRTWGKRYVVLWWKSGRKTGLLGTDPSNSVAELVWNFDVVITVQPGDNAETWAREFARVCNAYNFNKQATAAKSFNRIIYDLAPFIDPNGHQCWYGEIECRGEANLDLART